MSNHKNAENSSPRVALQNARFSAPGIFETSRGEVCGGGGGGPGLNNHRFQTPSIISLRLALLRA